MASKILLQHNLLPLDAVSLGRLVADVRHPQRRYHDPFEKIPRSSVQVERDVKEILQRVRNNGAAVSLTELLTLFKTKHNAQGLQVEAVMAVTYTLDQWEDIFRSACKLQGTREWLEDAIEDGKVIYFIVGYRTFVDAATTSHAQVGSDIKQSLQLPVGTVIDANLPNMQLKGSLDPKVNFSNRKDDFSQRTSKVSGESVYAIQYCKVSFKWYSSRKVDSSFLGDNKWRVYLGVRGEDDDDGEEDNDDILGAELETSWQTVDETMTILD